MARQHAYHLLAARMRGGRAPSPRTPIAFLGCIAVIQHETGMPPTYKTFLSGPGVPGLVSIIIPCYNRARIVGETIDSVLSQTYSNFEMILVDDGSTDDTREVIAAYDDRRIRYFYRHNGGLSRARNSGLDAATGEFVAFLDSDDMWHSWKLRAQMQIFARHPEVGLIWSDMSTFATAGEVLAERHLRDYYAAYEHVSFERDYARAGTLAELAIDAPAGLGGCPYYVADVFHHMFSGNLVHPPTAIVRRDRLRKSGPFEPEVTGFGAEDYHFYFRICSHGAVAFLDAPTTLYRVHASQMTAYNTLNEARANLNVVKHWLERRPPTLPLLVVRQSLANSHAWLGAEELSAGNERVAMYHLWQSLRLRATQPSTMLLLLVSLLPRRVTDALRVLKRAVRGMLVRPLTGIGLFLADEVDILTEFASLLQSGLAVST